jgi:uncharacterized protein YecE (DUF72 family)
VAGNCHIGTSGWSYAGWKGKFYPADLPARSFLSYYTSIFDCVELNASFYNLPRETTAEKWKQETPEQFFICPKISRFLTHIKRLKEYEEPLLRFFTVFDHLRDKLGPVLVQLPPSLKFEEEIARPFFTHLKKQYGDYRFALEGRHVSWLEQEALDLLKEFNIAFVISQSGGFFPYAEHVTANFIYVRFHGPESLFSSNYSYQYLKAFSIKIKAWLADGNDVWCFFNNDVYAYAPANAQTLIKYVDPAQ